ncbi:hypothetical protein KDA11_01410 [Candidatus Saccharibacteria bacterium]|nr:hypothetical protein [Candidatus Saccharibacteria bacterium]
MNIQNVPQELRELKQWLVWRYTIKEEGGKPEKVPYHVKGFKSNVTNYSHYCTFEECLTVVDNYDGLAFCFTEHDPYIGIDIDVKGADTLENHHAYELISMLGTYAEYSPSGKGVHLIAKLPNGFGPGRRTDTFEVYDRGRFFTMTGDTLNNAPVSDISEYMEYIIKTHLPARIGAKSSSTQANKALTLDDKKLLNRIWKHDKYGKQNKARYDGLLVDNGDASQARFYLIRCLYNWTNDVDRVVRLLWSSNMDKTKWNELRGNVPFIEYDVQNIVAKYYVKAA